MINQDIIKCAINAFSRVAQWMSIIDSFYIFKNLKVCTLDEFFSTIELHESRIVEIEHRDGNIALATTQKGSNSDSFLEGDQRSIHGKENKGPMPTSKLLRKKKVRCFNWDKGHIKDQCLNLKKKGKEKVQPKSKVKNLKATWSDTSFFED